MTCPSSRRKGFTLVELLVVIGIIAVLIGILLPSLSKARQAANTTKCLSNLRQLGTAFKLYETEYNGMWPVGVHQVGSTRVPINVERRWPDLLYPFLGGSQDITSYTDIQKDKKMSTIWGCPEWLAIQDRTSQDTQQVRVGYGMNIYTAGFLDNLKPGTPAVVTSESLKHMAYIDAASTRGEYPKAVSAYTQPAQRALLVDDITHVVNCPLTPLKPTDTWYNGSLNATSGVTFQVDAGRHGHRGANNTEQYSSPCINVLFCDGHASTVSIKDAYIAIRQPQNDNEFPQ